MDLISYGAYYGALGHPEVLKNAMSDSRRTVILGSQIQGPRRNAEAEWRHSNLKR